MAPRKRNKQAELNRTYRNADVGRVGSSLRNQGFSQNSKGSTYYTVSGVTYNAATGKPVKKQNKSTAKPAAKSAPKPQPAAAPRPTAVTSGGGPATPPASRPTSSGSGGSGATSKIHTYKDHGSALHVGRYKTLKEHQEAVARAKGGGSTGSTTSPKADIRTSRLGTDFGGAGGGNYNTPQDKSRYVASDGRPYSGPAFGNDSKPNTKRAATSSEKRTMTLAEQIRRRRQGLA